ncbi:hypothetical protein FQA47_018873 [Oryzias melastigma]|uniref:Uncharacterized protein n=1 Tax=Oryzias melastigma TaxID=30732 RepID=A0A834CIJ0_ORYME|nr:hypothetical protein FQA47_018873 [Oryzias melastigma]
MLPSLCARCPAHLPNQKSSTQPPLFMSFSFMVTKHFGLKQHFLLHSIYATLRNTTVMTRDLQLSSQRDTVMHTNRAKLLPVHEGVFPNSANGIVSSSYLTELAWS